VSEGFQQRDQSGVLFRNDGKQKAAKEGNSQAQKWPDYRGNCMVNGKTMEVSGWVKTARNGKQFLSLGFRPPRDEFDQRPDEETMPTQEPPPPTDDLPF